MVCEALCDGNKLFKYCNHQLPPFCIFDNICIGYSKIPDKGCYCLIEIYVGYGNGDMPAIICHYWGSIPLPAQSAPVAEWRCTSLLKKIMLIRIQSGVHKKEIWRNIENQEHVECVYGV